jgi:pimeloyl-ACP methyl ester carboxylesterase
MGRGWKIGLAALVASIALLAVNTLLVGGETGSAEVTMPGGRVLDLPGGEMQVVEGGRRQGTPIVLIHCYTCASDWWDGMRPALERRHRVVAVDLLGHGGSDKPGSGYTPAHQAELLAQALERLGVSHATLVGHSLGGIVAVALAEQAPDLVDRVAILDMPPDNTYGEFGFPENLAFQPVLGEALWRIKPDFSIRDGLEVAFAPGFEVPDAFVEDVKRLTYTAYDETPTRDEEFLDEGSLDRRMRATALPLLAIMGAEEQLVDDPRRALAQYADGVPGAETHLIAAAGHSPNVEKPMQTARLILRFAKSPVGDVKSPSRDEAGSGAKPQRSFPAASPNRASGVRSATGDQ